MRSLLSLFRPTQTEVAMQEDLTRGFEIKKPATPTPSRSTRSSTAGGSEVETLRASLADMDARLQSAIAERDQLKAEFSSYRQSANEDVSDLERLNRDLKSQLRTTGMELMKHIASTGQPGPLPSGFADDSPQGKTEAHYLKVAREMKGTTGDNPSRIERP
jgi:hypothetical protein